MAGLDLNRRQNSAYNWLQLWWWNTVSNAWYYFSNKRILKGEIMDAKMKSFSSDFQTLMYRNFLNEFEKVLFNFSTTIAMG